MVMKHRPKIPLWLLPLLGFFLTEPAFGLVSEAWNYLKEYQLGFDYTSSYDRVDASYEAPKAASTAPGCQDVQGKPTRQRCSVEMRGGGGSGPGIFLQQAFRRQGLFYFRPDIGFGVRYLSGALTPETQKDQAEAGLPLKDLRFSLAAVVIRPYVQFGITPASRWPDLLISLGPQAQVAFGTVRTNTERANVVMATSSSGLVSGFLAAELVLWRFGDGAFSLFLASDLTGKGQGTKFFPRSVDTMDDIRANFSHSVGGGILGLGLKLLLNWP